MVPIHFKTTTANIYHGNHRQKTKKIFLKITRITFQMHNKLFIIGLESHKFLTYLSLFSIFFYYFCMHLL